MNKALQKKSIPGVYVPLHETKRNKFRALFRLLLLLSITFYHMCRYILVGIFKKFTRAHAAKATQLWSVNLAKLSGIDIAVSGKIPPEGALLVSNHRSYIDIAVIGKNLPCTFLSKAEVASWPVVGQAARLAKVLFVRRDDPKSRKQSRGKIAAALKDRISVIIFPEGTSFDGPSILPFKQGVFQIAADGTFSVVPVAIEYADKNDAWVGDDTFISHFLRTFAKKQISCSICFGPAIKHSNPAILSEKCQDWIKNKLTEMQQKQKEPLNN